MNDPKFAVKKLRAMLKQALGAESDHEKAALYAAARWLLADLQAESDKQRLGLGEGILRVRDALAAMTQFDAEGGRGREDHYTLGMHGIKSLESHLGPGQC